MKKSTKKSTKKKDEKRDEISNYKLEYLVHTTSLYDFNNILKTKKIKSIPDPVSDDEYFEKSSNGPITQAIFNLDANHKINTANLHGLIIVLSKSILKSINIL